MIYTGIFQLFAFFFFWVIFLNDRHNQSIVANQKRLWYSILLFISFDFLVRILLVNDSQILIWNLIFGSYEIILNIKNILRPIDFVTVIIYMVGIPLTFLMKFPSFIIFWIWFSKNTKIKLLTTMLYILWVLITVWIYINFDIEQCNS